MTTATLTFDQMERCADRTFALALWAKHARRIVRVTMTLTIVSQATRMLVKGFTPERLEALDSKQAIELTKRLQELHSLLLQLCRSTRLNGLANHPIFGGSIRSLQDSTEDLGEIIEDLVLSENEQFKSLIARAAQGLQEREKPQLTGTFGRM
jgi:hypothetical protein